MYVTPWEHARQREISTQRTEQLSLHFTEKKLMTGISGQTAHARVYARVAHPRDTKKKIRTNVVWLLTGMTTVSYIHVCPITFSPAVNEVAYWSTQLSPFLRKIEQKILKSRDRALLTEAPAGLVGNSSVTSNSNTPTPQSNGSVGPRKA